MKLLASLLVFLSVAQSVYAGGGLVSFESTPQGPINPGTAYTLFPKVIQTDGSPCQSCPIKIKLENPQKSDIFNPTSDKTDEKGTMFVKIVSNIAGNRIAYAEVTMPDGSTYTSSKFVLNYTTDLSSVDDNDKSTINEEDDKSNITPIASPSSSDKKVEELNKKIENLEDNLAKTQKKQNFLESQLNYILNLIKSIFPFLK